MSEWKHGPQPPPKQRTATPVASRGSGTTKLSNLNGQTYPALSLPDKAALASDITADGRLRASDKVVALALLFRFHNTRTGQCNPSYERLAKSCGLERRAVINAIHRLEAASRLTINRTTGGRNRRNQYWFSARPAETVTSGTPIYPETVNAEAQNREPPFTPDGEPAFTRIEPRNLNTGKEHRNPSRSGESFDQFWSAYPRKVAKKGAERIFERIIGKGEATSAELITGAERYAEQCRELGTEACFIKHPTTWLNAGCWTDELAPTGAPNGIRAPNTLSKFSEAVLYRACGRDLEGRQ